jgi:hypothetical protein
VALPQEVIPNPEKHLVSHRETEMKLFSVALFLCVPILLPELVSGILVSGFSNITLREQSGLRKMQNGAAPDEISPGAAPAHPPALSLDGWMQDRSGDVESVRVGTANERTAGEVWLDLIRHCVSV